VRLHLEPSGHEEERSRNLAEAMGLNPTNLLACQTDSECYPRGDRWWRVWACPEHLDGPTGLRSSDGDDLASALVHLFAYGNRR
jgi:hypothetical protein